MVEAVGYTPWIAKEQMITRAKIFNRSETDILPKALSIGLINKQSIIVVVTSFVFKNLLEVIAVDDVSKSLFAQVAIRPRIPPLALLLLTLGLLLLALVALQVPPDRRVLLLLR